MLDKPKAITEQIDHGRRISFRLINPELPGGLANVCYTQTSWDIKVTLRFINQNDLTIRAGSLWWYEDKPEFCGVAVSSEKGFWGHFNTAAMKFRYRTYDAGFYAVRKFIIACLKFGEHTEFRKDHRYEQ